MLQTSLILMVATNCSIVCIADIFKTYFVERNFVKPISVILDDGGYIEDNILPCFIDDVSQWPLYVTNLTSFNKSFKKSTNSYMNYVVNIRNVEDIRYVITKIKDGDSFWNNEVKLLISMMNYQDKQDFFKTLKSIIQFEDISAIIVTRDEVMVVKGTNCVWNDFNIIDKCNKSVIVVENPPNKTYKALVMPYEPNFLKITNNSLIKYDYFARNGVEYDVLALLSELFDLNVTLVVSGANFKFGGVWENGSIDGVFFKVHQNEYDIFLGNCILTPARLLFFYYTYPVLFGSLYWFVPHNLKENTLDDFNKLADKYALFLLMFFMLFIALSIRIFGGHKMTSTNIVFMLYTVMIGVTYNIPKHRNVRLIISTVIWLNIFANVLFLTALTSNLSNVEYKQTIDSEEDILKSNLDAHVTIPHFFDNSILRSKLKECYRMKECLHMVADRKIAFAVTTINQHYIINNYTDENEIPRIHYIQAKIALTSLTFFMRRGFPLYQQFSKKLIQLGDAGFVTKFHKDVESRHFYEKLTESGDIKLKHLQNLFILLIMIYALSFLILLLEIVLKKNDKNP
ncbi:unnamed protein product [Brassicogethes aeneus]|uniref:Uncharacterized protein n=1 Tax=Brassicogethes aeneus TaxID=1431903 RepID=A0A9P0BI68_BRAAE|nr:unnamed protein product [Brassicogethes aeneus]